MAAVPTAALIAPATRARAAPVARAQPPAVAAVATAPDLVSSSLSAVQEAAILFAAGFDLAAVATLLKEIESAQGRRSKEGWLALFNVYLAMGRRGDFAGLAIKYTLRFEESPPTWTELDRRPDPGLPKAAKQDVFVLEARAGGLSEELSRLESLASMTGLVRIDVSKAIALAAGDADALSLTFRRLRARKQIQELLGAARLENALRQACRHAAEDDRTPYWAALFEVLILTGDAAEFERLSMDYALAYEVSPPVWEIYSTAATLRPRQGTEPSEQRSNVFLLSGRVAGDSTPQLGEIHAYAAGKLIAVVDCSGVRQFDYAELHHFVEGLRTLNANGKKLVLTQLSEINAAALEAFGAARYAMIIRAKGA